MNAIRDWMGTPFPDWQAFVDRFMLPGAVIGSARGGGKSTMQRRMLAALVESTMTRYQRRRLESLRNRSNRATQWGKRGAWDGSVARTRLPRWCVTWGYLGKVNRRRANRKARRA